MSFLSRLNGWQRLWVVAAFVFLPVQMFVLSSFNVPFDYFGVGRLQFMLFAWILTVSSFYVAVATVFSSRKVWMQLLREQRYYALLNRLFGVYFLVSLPYYIQTVYRVPSEVWVALGLGVYVKGVLGIGSEMLLIGSEIENITVWASRILVEYVEQYIYASLICFGVIVTKYICVKLFGAFRCIVGWVVGGFSSNRITSTTDDIHK